MISKLGEQAVVLRDLLTRSGGEVSKEFLRSWGRFPMRYRAEQTIGTIPALSLGQMLADLGIDEMVISPEGADSDHHGWGLRALEQQILAAMVRSTGSRRIFEIGTFDGGTTRLLAVAAGEEGTVHTIDLAPAEFDRTQFPDAFDGSMVGRKFRDTDEAPRIVQLLGDSTTFDFSPWFGQIDLVFVDGGHDEVHGRADSLNALRMVRPGGLVVWDDFASFWWGLVKGIAEVCDGRDLTRIAGTNFAYLKA
jgi:predicted O-methyltransferase YrrM